MLKFRMACLAGTLIVILIGCSSDPAEDHTVPPHTPTVQADVSVSADDLEMFASLEEMVVAVEFVFLGTVLEVEGHYNLARNVADVTEPDPHIFALGQIYRVQVDRYLKGEGGSIQQVVQSEGLLTEVSRQVGLSQTDEDLRHARLQEEHIPMQVGQQYLFFVDRSSVKPEYLLRIAGDPWRYRLDSESAELDATSEIQDIVNCSELEIVYDTESLIQEIERLLSVDRE